MTIDRRVSLFGAAPRLAMAAARRASRAARTRLILPLLVAAGATLSGCASTQFSSAGQMPEEPLCERATETVSALIFWGAQWRADQKEPVLREAAAKRGIERFFAESQCFTTVRVLQVVGDRPALEVPADDARALAARERPAASRALYITIRELGPVLKVFSSLALVEGGSDVVFDVRSLDLATGQPSSDFQAHWQRGGPWVIKGTGSLDTELQSALAATLRPRAKR